MKRNVLSLFSILFLTVFVVTKYDAPQTRSEYSYFNTRGPSSTPDMERLETLLAVDKFDYYVGEYINNFGKKIDKESLEALKAVKVEYIIANFANDSRIKDAKNYDAIVYDIIKDKLGKKPSGTKASYEWGYNFFKNKLNEGFTLFDTNIKPGDASAVTSKAPSFEYVMPDSGVKSSQLTLDADHYISNRTTRAVFWEAAESKRDVEFHLENSREFLKNLQDNGATIINEIRPFANNYNKIYAVQYPGEDTYRYAITGIGGKDRLNHLILQFGLSKGENVLENKVRIFGDIDKAQKAMEDELAGVFKHLPQTDRVIIGQKGAIERTFETLWKIRALKNLYDDEPDSVLAEIPEKLKDSFKQLMADGDIKKYDIFKNKKGVEDAFKKLQKKIESKGINPHDFKKFEYDNYVISMSDLVFKNEKGEEVVWRVVANSWGDEIAPLARALKSTGNNKITYIGTAGAFPDKGYSVGDLVIPSHTRLDGESKKLKGTTMQIDGAKEGGVVDHVYSPFIETQQWLEDSKQHSDFVEVEVSHLRKILNGNDDDLKAYLLISDVLNSEGETLASATGSKRRNSLNKLLYAMLDRDSVGIPDGVDINDNKIGKLRSIIDEVLGTRGNTLKYFVFSKLKDQASVTASDVKAVVDSVDNFSDNYFTKRLTEASETTSYVLRSLEELGHMPKISISRNLVEGDWHPKTDKIIINVHADTDALVDTYKEVVANLDANISNISKFCEINFVRGPPTQDFVTIPKYVGLDSDYLVSVYSQSAFKQAGLDAQVTYNGNLKFNFLPTVNNTEVCPDDKFCHLAFFKPDATTKNLLSDFDTIEKFKAAYDADARDIFKEKIEQYNSRLRSRGQSELFIGAVEVEHGANLSDGRLAEIVPEFSDEKGLIVKVKFSDEGWKNPMVILEEMIHVNQIVDYSNYFKHPMLWAEAALNAEYGSMRSRELLARAEVDAMDELSNFMGYKFNDSQYAQANNRMREYAMTRKEHANKIAKNFKTKVRAENKVRKSVSQNWKELHKALEAQNLKLDDYIAKGNRKKVVELIEAYMPWENMEPTEIAAWTRWLKAMETPPGNDFKVSFRGIGGDLIRESDDGGYFLMSKLLTKNQGSYTRRLRSLKTYFDKKLGPKAASEINTNIQSLTAVFKAHSHEPLGSPYLSSSVYSVAKNFASESGGAKMAAIKLSPERSVLNMVSDYGELEEMIPMIIFPDEIIDIEHNGDFNAHFARVEVKINRPIREVEKTKNVVNSDPKLRMKSTKEWWDSINPKGITHVQATRTCKDVMKMFLSQK